ncbi:MAG TPA: hypothetical protein VGE06_09630, partial [Flavisolibacter sp.]
GALEWGTLKHLLFGDYISVSVENGGFVERVQGGKTYIRVRSRNANGYILKKDIQAERILEVNFVDVGQGDGCHLVTPSDKHYILDAGAKDNMYRFLKWRFNLQKGKNAPPVFRAVISHPDSDHYQGFGHIFIRQTKNKQQFNFDRIYHNGIVERSTGKKLGETTAANGKTYITGLLFTDNEMRAHLENTPGGSLYQRTLKKAAATYPGARFEALCREDAAEAVYLVQEEEFSVEVLGPLLEKQDNQKALRYFPGKNSTTNDVGRTKNGHSVVLKIQFGKIKILLGGDLNPPAEDYLLEHYTGTDIARLREDYETAATPAEKETIKKEMEAALAKAREHFQVDIAKSCHHGSADFTTEFLQAVNPLVTVVSSGDDEPHCHPRPDTLGTLGKFSRGDRSFIFCTELMRSGKEFINIKDLRTTEGKERVVIRYGMINLRTDGQKLIMAQKLERDRGSQSWDIHRFEWDEALNTLKHIAES